MIRLHRLLWPAIALLAGCPPHINDDDDTSDDDAADDDAGDDDAGDDDAGDDDSGDDDSGDDDTSYPYGYTLEFTTETSGGPAGGPSTTWMTHTMVDSDCEELCHVSFEFQGEYTFGPVQGDDFWTPMDEIVTWTGGGEVENTCPPQWPLYKGDPVEWFRWYLHPLAAVSCEQVAADPKLAVTFVGDDPWSHGDGTLGDWCAVTGPELQPLLGTGPVEGIWLAAGTPGSLDGLGNYAYFAPDDTTNVSVWLINGFLMADAANGWEPTEGLEGAYVHHPIWTWYGGGC